MVFLRQLRRLIHRDGAVHMHPRKMGDELMVLQHTDEILPEASALFHVKVSVPYLKMTTCSSYLDY